VDVIIRETPDAVVIATGARPGVPTTPGIMDSPAVDPFEVLRRPVTGLRRALVIGGGLVGVGVAHVLAERGVDEVVLAEAGADLATEIGLRPRWQHVANLRARPNVTIHVRTTVERLDAGGALLRRDGVHVTVEALDLVVATRPLVSVSELLDDLRRTPAAPPFFSIGDAVQPRTAFEAMQDAAALAHRL
jgi:pyruvate/2-oxoglutarate dehydrogenase complex dihydrolipoamide dehydrogenase (E3) component